MKLKYIIRTANRGLKANRTRSALTILGIVIGITAIMLVVSLGAGAQAFILSEVQGLGAQTIAVLPGRQPTSPAEGAETLLSDSLKERDLIALKNKANVPGLMDIIPVVINVGNAQYESNTYQATIFGGTDLAQTVLDLKVTQGDFFDATDVQDRSSVVVLGHTIADKLFGQSDAVGEVIKIKGKSLRVIGVLGPSGGSLFNTDEMVVVPYTTAQTYLLGINYYNRLIIEAAPGTNVQSVANDVKLTLRESHGITDPSKDDFSVQTQEELAATVSTITNALTYFLAAVAGIALFVGGIGIMNIMLVSVTERTREIGLRKALGATEKDIQQQFLIESVMLTGIGGLIGIALGAFLAFLAAIALSKGLGINWQFVFPWLGAILGFGMSALIGLVFGLYPARQASRKSPIEALRYE